MTREDTRLALDQAQRAQHGEEWRKRNLKENQIPLETHAYSKGEVLGWIVSCKKKDGYPQLDYT